MRHTIGAALLRAEYTAIIGAVLHYDGTVGIHLCGRLPASCKAYVFRQYQMSLAFASEPAGPAAYQHSKCQHPTADRA